MLLLAMLAAAASDASLPLPKSEHPAPAGIDGKHLPWPVRAEFVAPTGRYAHGILGRIPGWGGLVIDLQLCRGCNDERIRQMRIDLPKNRVFEDIAPHLWDITGDGRPEIVAVETDADKGARLAVWEARMDDEEDAPLVALRANQAGGGHSTSFLGFADRL